MADLPYAKISKKTYASLFSWILFVSLEALVIGQAFLAYQDQFLTLAQMQQNKVKGLPFLWHFGMWGDFFIISPILAFLVAHYSNQWRASSVMISLMIATLSTGFLGWFYTLSSIPEAHMVDHHLTSAGIAHLLYMVIAFTILLLFFLFTKFVKPLEMLTVSCLICFHVVLGTHLALGVLQKVIGFTWYPGNPLNSVSGYLTLLIIATTLFWRNMQVEMFAKTIQTGVERAARFFMYWIEDDIYCQQKVKTPHGLLSFLDKVGDRVLEASFFVYAAWNIFKGNDGIKSLLPGILVIVFAIKFRLSRRSVKVELAIGEKLFSAGRLPEGWSGPREPVGIILSVFYFFALYMTLAWFANKIILVSLVMFVIGCIDWNTRRLIHKNINEFFSEEKYSPQADDKDFKAITARREVVSRFLFDHPHLWKEGACAAGCGLALIVALFANYTGSDLLRNVAYIIIFITLVANEVITWRWRSVRDKSLIDIEMVPTGESYTLAPK